MSLQIPSTSVCAFLHKQTSPIYSTIERAVQHEHEAPPLLVMADTTDTGLLRLPNELILDISDLIPTTGGLNALTRTNHRTYALLNPYLYGRDAREGKGYAIRWSTEKGLVRTAELALEAGTDVDVIPSKKTSLLCEEIRRLPEILRYDKTQHFTPLQLAIVYKNQGVAILLIHHGANIKARMYPREQQLSLLHVASGLGLVEVMQALLDRGIKVETLDRYGQTPLHHAVRPNVYAEASGSAAAVALLLDKGASITTLNRHWHTPLDVFSTAPALILHFPRFPCCSREPEPQPVCGYQIRELLRNKAVVLRVQKLDRERAKKLEEGAKRPESAQRRPQRKR